MNFYNNIHPYYCGIALHARLFYVCIFDQDGNTLCHKGIPAEPEQLKALLKPYIELIEVRSFHAIVFIEFFSRSGIAMLHGKT